MHKISAVGLFCYDKFEETPKQKVIDLSKLKDFYFNSDILFENIPKGRESYNFDVWEILSGDEFQKGIFPFGA